MSDLLLFIVLPLAFISIVLARAIKRGIEMRRLVTDGVETTGQVIRRVKFRSGTNGRLRFLRYEYIDGSGQRHSHRSAMTVAEWESYEEGGPIEVVYSMSKPHVSAPKKLVDLARHALAKSSGSR